MVVHHVNDNSDDDCNGYTDVEYGISEWNLRWAPRTACDGGRNKHRRNADQEHGRSPELRRYYQHRETSERDNSWVCYFSAGWFGDGRQSDGRNLPQSEKSFVGYE